MPSDQDCKRLACQRAQVAPACHEANPPESISLEGEFAKADVGPAVNANRAQHGR